MIAWSVWICVNRLIRSRLSWKKLVWSNDSNLYELLNIIPFQECVITWASGQHFHISEGGKKNESLRKGEIHTRSVHDDNLTWCLPSLRLSHSHWLILTIELLCSDAVISGEVRTSTRDRGGGGTPCVRWPIAAPRCFCSQQLHGEKKTERGAE